MKMKFKRFLSGVMAVATLASVIVQPVAVSASELEPEEIPFEQQYPELKDVQNSLDSDEIVAANDIELAYGQEFEVEVDLSGIEGVDESKMKILFHEAKNEDGADFDTHTPDTYKAVYAVEPVSGHPSYRISRNITVKEPETEQQSESSSEIVVDDNGDTGDTELSDDDSDSHRETENEIDSETGLTVSEALEQAESNGIDLYAMDAGETITFMASAGNARSSQQVSVTRGTMYRYADYGYGSYLTYQYTVKFGNVSATAYCVQPSKPGPGTGTYTINKVGDGKALAKVCYYGTKASGDDGFFTEENGYGNLSAGARFILVHLAASYANGSGDAFSGANSTAQNLAKKLYNYCVSQPDIPSVAMSFSDANVKAYVDGNSQRTKDITFNADTLQTITMKLPAGVQLHNLTTGKTSKAGESVEICGGTKFYLSAPLTQVSDVAESWSSTMKGSITKDYSAYKITTGSGTQDLALVFGEGVDDEKYVDFKVSWIELATVEVVKKDSTADVNLAGAVFGIYSDPDCKNLITTMPETDSNGKSSATIVKTQDTVYLKEITAPKGYVLNTTAYNVKLVASKTTSTTVPDKEQLGELTVYKEGQVLAGADVSDSGVTFKYENRRLKGAVYNVYAGADIMSAYGAKGKRPVQMGFKEAEEAFRKSCVKAKKEDELESRNAIPEGYKEKMVLSGVKAEKSTHYISPPKMFTEDTLLAAMETAGNKEFDSETEKKGLGTPATRASIIEKLVSSGYAKRKGKQILPTAEGCELIHVMPENLKSASLTAEWENQLLMMEKGRISDTEFMDGIVALLADILALCRAIPEDERNRFQTAKEVIGKCPVCGSDIYEGKTNYYCSDRGCSFALWKSNRFLESMEKSMDKKMAVELLKKGRTHVKGLYSRKKDIKFDADLVLGVEDGKARFSLEFPKKKPDKKKK